MTRERLLLLGLSAAAVHILRQRRKLKYARIQFNKLQETVNYLLTAMEEQGVELEEFDIMALNTILSED